MDKKKTRVYTNSLYRRITCVYAVILVLIGLLACYLAYSKAKNDLMNQMDQAMLNLNYEYESITDDFWRLYMPIWTYKDSVYNIIETFFSENRENPLSPIERADLLEALQIIMSGDDRMKWIGVFRGEGRDNYLLFASDASLVEMPVDFPFAEELANREPGMKVFPSRVVSHNSRSYRSFAACGGTPPGMGKGSIIMGYDTASIKMDRMSFTGWENTDYYITNSAGVIFDSTNRYDHVPLDFISGKTNKNADGKRIFVRLLDNDSGTVNIFCVVPRMDIFIKCHGFTPFIAAVLMVFWLCSLLLYKLASRKILEKINSIQYGLVRIRGNDLAYRIPLSSAPTDEFEHIGSSINEMAADLQENIDKTFLLKLRQRQTELSELQSKFDPHFLYNTLEIIRGKAYENGDEETGDVIVNLVQIFRKFIGADRFISISEEMEFCNLYLSLLEYRYDDAVMICYDIDPEIMQYGIIRNLLQPILENYFVHGYNRQKQDNRLLIQGRILDQSYICLKIKDNGMGIPEERLLQLQNHMDSVGTGAKSSYGLKNVNRRIKLFYGQECGLEVDRNSEGGATIRIKIRKMSCEEHEEKFLTLE